MWASSGWSRGRSSSSGITTGGATFFYPRALVPPWQLEAWGLAASWTRFGTGFAGMSLDWAGRYRLTPNLAAFIVGTSTTLQLAIPIWAGFSMIVPSIQLDWSCEQATEFM